MHGLKLSLTIIWLLVHQVWNMNTSEFINKLKIAFFLGYVSGNTSTTSPLLIIPYPVVMYSVIKLVEFLSVTVLTPAIIWGLVVSVCMIEPTFYLYHFVFYLLVLIISFSFCLIFLFTALGIFLQQHVGGLFLYK